MKLKIKLLVFTCLITVKMHAQWNPISGGYNYSGNIGIGSTMTSLTGALHVNGLNASGWSYFSGNVNGAGNPLNIQALAFGWNKSAGAGESLIVYNTSLGGYPRLSFNSFNGTTFSEEMTLAGGKLGIGTNSPQSKLHIANGEIRASDPTFNDINVRLDGTSIPSIKFTRYTGSPNTYHNAFAGQFYNATLGQYIFGIGTGSSTSGDQNATINALAITLNGNVGIGTTNPSQRMHISGSNPHGQVASQIENTDSNSDSFAPIQFKTGASPSVWQIFARNGDLFHGIANVADYMVIKNGGNIGIGTAGPSEKLTVQGNIQVPLLSSIGYLQSTDKFVHNGNTIGNYSLGSVNDSWQSGAPTAIFSGFGGIKLVAGAQPRLSIDISGNVGIGTTSPNQKLTVNGTIYGKEVKVDLGVPGPDYVFEPAYNLSPLDSIKTYLDKNKHLPEVPSAKEMEKNGVNLGEMNMLLLKKIEELTLYVIEQQKEIKELKEAIKK